MESNENGENIEQRYSEISDHKDDGDKLNINTKKAESSRDEMIPKEEKTDDKNRCF